MSEGLICWICGNAVPNEEDYRCHGCKELICDNHYGNAYGHGHDPMMHDEPDEEFGDDPENDMEF